MQILKYTPTINEHFGANVRDIVTPKGSTSVQSYRKETFQPRLRNAQRDCRCLETRHPSKRWRSVPWWRNRYRSYKLRQTRWPCSFSSVLGALGLWLQVRRWRSSFCREIAILARAKRNLDLALKPCFRADSRQCSCHAQRHATPVPYQRQRLRHQRFCWRGWSSIQNGECSAGTSGQPATSGLLDTSQTRNRLAAWTSDRCVDERQSWPGLGPKRQDLDKPKTLCSGGLWQRRYIRWCSSRLHRSGGSKPESPSSRWRCPAELCTPCWRCRPNGLAGSLPWCPSRPHPQTSAPRRSGARGTE